MIEGAIVGGAIGLRSPHGVRYRCEYIHLSTSSRIIFTVMVPWYDYVEGDMVNSALEAMAKRFAAKWIEQTGLVSECVMLGVVALTDKMSVR